MSDPARFVESGPILRADDALDLVGACAARDTDRLLIDSADLPEEFFDLSTTFAGAFLQKLQNYRIRTAAIFPPDGGYSEPFADFVSEARTSNTFRTFTDRDAAVEWLTS